MAKKKPPTDAQIRVKVPAEILPNDGIPVFYVNHIDISISNWDMRFRMGQIQGANPDGQLRVMEIGNVYMAHEHARALLGALAQTIEKLDKFLASRADSGAKAEQG